MVHLVSRHSHSNVGTFSGALLHRMADVTEKHIVRQDVVCTPISHHLYDGECHEDCSVEDQYCVDSLPWPIYGCSPDQTSVKVVVRHRKMGRLKDESRVTETATSVRSDLRIISSF